MQVQLKTDSHIQGNEALAQWVDRDLNERLARFSDVITRIDVHLSDASGARTGEADKRCLLEARLSGRPPVAVSHDAAKVADAVHGAADKLMRALESALGRRRDAHARESIRGE